METVLDRDISLDLLSGHFPFYVLSLPIESRACNQGRLLNGWLRHISLHNTLAPIDVAPPAKLVGPFYYCTFFPLFIFYHPVCERSPAIHIPVPGGSIQQASPEIETGTMAWAVPRLFFRIPF